MEETLEKLLLKALEVAEKTGEFVIEQAPDLLKEFYTWHTVADIFYILLSVILMAIGVTAFKKLDVYNGSEGKDAALVILMGASTTAGPLMFFMNLYDLLFILIAPKLYLIEYFIK